MAIAPLPDLESPWPRPALRLVEPVAGLGGWSTTTGAPAAAVPVRDRMVGEPGAVARRRTVSARVRRRRRQVLVGLAVTGAAVGLVLPVSSLGGRPAAGVPGPSAVVGTGSTVYVVQPGDTLWSIAARIDRGGDPRPLAEALARETGSSTVVPGERIRVP